MRNVFLTDDFKRSLKRLERSGLFKFAAKEKLEMAVAILASGEALPPFYFDHALIGDWLGCRECHIKGDVLLVYKLSDEWIDLVDIGSHSYLFE